MNKPNDLALQGADNFWNEYEAEEWSDALVQSMKLGGIDNLYFVSGSEMAFFQEAIAKGEARKRPVPKLVTMMHESVALHAALGSAMVTGQPAAAAVHVDVGTLHYGAAIHAAWRGNYPVLMTAGCGPRAFPNSMRGARDGTIQWLQEPRDQGEIVRQYTKVDHRLEAQDNPGLMISRLLQIAVSEPKGPAFISLPREMTMQEFPGAKTRFPTRDQLGLSVGTYPDPEHAKTIAKWLVKAANPLVLTERIGKDPNAVRELVKLAELLALPVSEPTNAQVVNFPSTHALYGTGPATTEADVCLVLESIAPWLPGEETPPKDAKIAWVSVDPVQSRFKTMEFRADLWIPATPANVVRAIYAEAEKILDKSDMTRIADRRKRLEAKRREFDAGLEAQAKKFGAQKSHGGYVAYELGKILEPEAILLNDGLSNGTFVQNYARRDLPGTCYKSGSSCGGWGVGAAFGAKMAKPDCDVVLASGDGFFQFGTPDAALWAGAHHKAGFLNVVFVNGSYSTGTNGLRKQYPGGYAAENKCIGGTFEVPPNFAKMCESVGGYGEYVEDNKDVGAALKRGLAETRKGVPAVIAVRLPSLG